MEISDDRQPKRPANAYMHFVKEVSASGDVSTSDRMKKCAELWRSLSMSEKEVCSNFLQLSDFPFQIPCLFSLEAPGIDLFSHLIIYFYFGNLVDLARETDMYIPQKYQQMALEAKNRYIHDFKSAYGTDPPTRSRSASPV